MLEPLKASRVKTIVVSGWEDLLMNPESKDRDRETNLKEREEFLEKMRKELQRCFR